MFHKLGGYRPNGQVPYRYSQGVKRERTLTLFFRSSSFCGRFLRLFTIPRAPFTAGRGTFGSAIISFLPSPRLLDALCFSHDTAALIYRQEIAAKNGLSVESDRSLGLTQPVLKIK